MTLDNGPEYISHELKNWLEKKQIKHQFIEPGKPQQNAYIKRFNRTVREELLSSYLFKTMDDVQIYSTKYNHESPHSAIESVPPCQI